MIEYLPYLALAGLLVAAWIMPQVACRVSEMSRPVLGLVLLPVFIAVAAVIFRAAATLGSPLNFVGMFEGAQFYNSVVFSGYGLPVFISSFANGKRGKS